MTEELAQDPYVESAPRDAREKSKKHKRQQTDLKAILAGIPTACDVHVDTFEWNKRAPPKR